MLPAFMEVLFQRLYQWYTASGDNGIFIDIRSDGVSIKDPKYGGSVTRASIALQFNHATSSYTQVASGVDRAQHDVYSSGLAAWELNQRPYGEPQRTNSALGSNIFGNTTYWSAASLSSTPAAASYCAIPSQSAYVLVNTGVAYARRTQAIGAFVSGQTDCTWWLLENISAVVSELDVYDSSGSWGGTYAGVTLTWSGLTAAASFAPAGTVVGVQNMGIGPNGGQMALLWITCVGLPAGQKGGAGNSRTIFLCPSGSHADTNSVITHHAQLEANALFPSTPIVTGAATATRNAEIVSVPLPAAAQSAQALAIYEKWVAGGGSALGTTGYRWNVGGSSAPLFSGAFNSSAQPTATINNGTDTAITDTAPAVAPAFSDGVETRDLVAATGTMQTGAAKNGGAETLAAASAAPAHGFVVPLGANTVYLGSLGSTAGHGAALGTFILAAATPAAPSLAQFRSFV